MNYEGRLNLTASDYSHRSSSRRVKAVLWSFFLSALFAVPFIILKGNLIFPAAVIALIIMLGVVWQYPRSLFSIMLIGACVIETYPLGFKDSFTDNIPLFWDVNTIAQRYGGMSNFHLIPFSLFEVFLILGGLAWFIRGTFYRTLKFRFGTLMLPISLYLVCVAIGLINGMATGGDFNTALFEVRGQFYFLFAYLMCLNTAEHIDEKVNTMLWVSAWAIGIKAIICSYRFIVTDNWTTVPELGIGSHEESFFFDCFIFQFLVLKMGDIQPKLRRVMIWLMPFVELANLANERRAATAAMALAIVALLVLSAVAFPKRRKAVSITAITIVVVASIYLPIFWNGTGTLAQPARAIKSQFAPDPRDASSNEYRDAENQNLMFTMRVNPVIGYGYGKPIREVTAMVDLTGVDPLVLYLTHNQILWVWMRVGTVGFYLFWILITTIIMQGCWVLKDPFANESVRAAAIIVVLIFIMEMVFGLLDMQIANERNDLYCGLWAGLTSAMLLQCREMARQEAEKLGLLNNRHAELKWNLPQAEQTVTSIGPAEG